MTFYLPENYVLSNYFFFGIFFIVKSLFTTYMHLFLNLQKLVYPLPFTFIFSILEFMPSIGPFDNLLGNSSLSRQSLILINEFIMYSFHVDSVLATSIKGSKLEP